MNAVRFAALSRVLTAAGSRRGALAAALGGALGLLGLSDPDDAAARSGKCKPKCGECQKCKKGDCDKKKNGKKVCKKGKCQAIANGTVCSVGTCQGGICFDPLPGTCTATQEEVCLEGDTVAARCNGNAGCACFTRTNNARICGKHQEGYCPSPGTRCATDADCPGDDGCAKAVGVCVGCGPSKDTFCIPSCGS